MPELPEVETVVRDLRPHLTGRTIGSVWRSTHKLRKPWKRAWESLISGSRVEAVRRRGKWIVLDLDADRHLVIHLGMTGQLTIADTAAPRPEHLHLVCDLQAPDTARQLRFRDVRRFGSATYLPKPSALDAFFQKAGLGPEPWDLDPEAWRAALAGTERPLKAVLLDQSVVAGVGNIYADESLFQAQLPPGLIGRKVTAEQAERLREAIVEVLTRAIEQRGSSIRDYVGGSGLRGSFQEEFRVYGRTGEPCPRCGTPIARVRLGGRSSHFCPHCQPAPRIRKRSRTPSNRNSTIENRK